MNAAADLAVGRAQVTHSRLRAEQALAIHRELGDDWGSAGSLYLLGHAAADEEDYEAARALWESLELWTKVGDTYYSLMATRMLAWADKELGESDRAARLMRDVLAVARARGDLHIQVHALESLAIDAAEEGRVDEAAGMLREAHELNCLLGDRYREAVIVCRFARVLAHAGRGEAAARVLATARCSTSRWGLVRWPGSRGKRRGSEPYPGATGRGRARRGPDAAGRSRSTKQSSLRSQSWAPMGDGRDSHRHIWPGISWGDLFADLSAARREGEPSAEDPERLAVAAYMVGRDDACEDAWVAAHQAWLGRGEAERAARCAFWHALGLFFRGDLAPAMGWVARGGRLLTGSPHDSVAHVWLRMLQALPSLAEGDAQAASSSFREAGEIAGASPMSAATAFARIGSGYALILQGRTPEGMALLDEVMVSVTAEEVAPMIAGIAYCQVIVLCQAVFDVRRAREWTDALTHVGVMRSPISCRSEATVSSIGARSSSCRVRGPSPLIPPGRRANGSLGLQRGTRSDQPITSWARSSGSAASSQRQRSRIGKPVWPGGIPSQGCRCFDWRRGGSISLPRRSAGHSTRRTIRSLGHAYCPRVSMSCSRPMTSKRHEQRPMSLLRLPRRSTPRT